MKRLAAVVFTIAAAQARQSPPVLRTETNEVLLDVVVRQKGGSFVRGLKPEDIEVYEDGVRQKVRTFRLVDGAEAPRASAGRIAKLT